MLEGAEKPMKLQNGKFLEVYVSNAKVKLIFVDKIPEGKKLRELVPLFDKQKPILVLSPEEAYYLARLLAKSAGYANFQKWKEKQRLERRLRKLEERKRKRNNQNRN